MISVNFFRKVRDGQCTKWRSYIAEIFNRLRRTNVTDRRQTDGRTTTYSKSEREFRFAKSIPECTTLIGKIQKYLFPASGRSSLNRPSVTSLMTTMWLFPGVFYGNFGKYLGGRFHADSHECRQVRRRLLSDVISQRMSDSLPGSSHHRCCLDAGHRRRIPRHHLRPAHT